MAKLDAAGCLVPGTRVNLVLSGTSVAVPAGAALPDISSEAAVRAAVLAAPRVSYSTGPSGVALARLYLACPPLWILDEPFTALDKQGVAQLEAHLAAHCEQGGMVVLTTHHTLERKPSGYRELNLGQWAA
jgi:ABC-type transport system involved in cytochrome c biogenesis ATPase subunit